MLAFSPKQLSSVIISNATGTFGCEDLKGLTFCITPAIIPGFWTLNTLIRQLVWVWHTELTPVSQKQWSCNCTIQSTCLPWRSFPASGGSAESLWDSFFANYGIKKHTHITSRLIKVHLDGWFFWAHNGGTWQVTCVVDLNGLTFCITPFSTPGFWNTTTPHWHTQSP